MSEPTIIIDADGTWHVTAHPSGATSRVLVEPSPTYLAAQEAERLAGAKERALRRVEERRFQAEDAGTEYDGRVLATDAHSRNVLVSNLLLHTMQQAPPETPVQWKDKDGVFFDTTFGWLQGATEAIHTYVNACYAHERFLKEALDAAEDPDEVDIESGWPDQPAS